MLLSSKTFKNLRSTTGFSRGSFFSEKTKNFISFSKAKRLIETDNGKDSDDFHNDNDDDDDDDSGVPSAEKEKNLHS